MDQFVVTNICQSYHSLVMVNKLMDSITRILCSQKFILYLFA